MAWWHNKSKFTPEDLKESKYNAALYKLDRIHEQWQLCHQLRRKGDIQGLSHYLQGVWLELSGDATKQQKQEYWKIRNKVIKCLVEAKKALRNEDIKKYKFFMFVAGQTAERQWEFITVIENAQGLGKAYKEYKDEDLF